MLLNTAIKNHLSQDDMPDTIIVVSDMEFDQGTRIGYRGYSYGYNSNSYTAAADTLMESIAKRWEQMGYEMPHLIYWNVNARQNNIPMLSNGRISYVSGFSPSIFQTIVTGKTGYELMMECLNKERYSVIQ